MDDEIGEVVGGLFEFVIELCFFGFWRAALTLTVLIGAGVGIYYLL